MQFRDNERRVRAHLNRRIRRLLDYEFPTRAIFSLTKVPAKADWDSQWFPPALAYDGFPLALRVVGSVVEVDVDGLRSLGGSASLALELMRDVDHDALVKLIRKGDSRSGECNTARKR